jgi:hypothetical protein
LLNEIAHACTTLTHVERRRAYDARLRRDHFLAAPPNRTDPPSLSAPVARPPIHPVPLARFLPASVSFDTQHNSESDPSPGASLFDPFALAYIALLLLGGLLAFWLGSTPPRPVAPSGTTRTVDGHAAAFPTPTGGTSRKGNR